MIYNLQVLRAAAAYLVVLYHFLVQQHDVFPEAAQIGLGAAGVDIFFVISGFIMVATTAGKAVTPLQFLSNRVARLFPVYGVVTLVIVLLFTVGFKPVGVFDVRSSYVIQSLLFIPFSRGGFVEPLVSVGWTLNYEMFFYVVFAALIAVRSERVRLLGLVIVLCGLGACRLGDPEGLYAVFYTRPIVVEFALGAILGHLHVRLAKAPAGRHARGAGYALLIAGVLVLLASEVVAQRLALNIELAPFLRPMTWGVGGCLIVAGALMLERGGLVCSNRFLIEQGNASYSIYLIHSLVLHASAKAAAAIVPSGWPSAAVTFVLALGATATLGVLMYRRIELPLNTALRTAFASWKGRVEHAAPR